MCFSIFNIIDQIKEKHNKNYLDSLSFLRFSFNFSTP